MSRDKEIRRVTKILEGIGLKFAQVKMRGMRGVVVDKYSSVWWGILIIILAPPYLIALFFIGIVSKSYEALKTLSTNKL